MGIHRLTVESAIYLWVLVAIPGAPRGIAPEVESPPGKTCTDATCHGEFLTRGVIHRPVARGKCDTCHEYAGRKHEFSLREPRETLCTSCHLVRWGASLHEPFANGECDRCHDPHGSSHRLLLTQDPAKDLCFACHEPEKIMPGSHRHQPAESGACILCHESHAS